MSTRRAFLPAFLVPAPPPPGIACGQIRAARYSASSQPPQALGLMRAFDPGRLPGLEQFVVAVKLQPGNPLFFTARPSDIDVNGLGRVVTQAK